MTPETRKALEDRIDREEGYRENPYRDTEGLWTIATGHLVHHLTIPTECVTVGDLLNWLTDKQRHKDWRDEDIDQAIRDAAKYLIGYYAQPENVQLVLADMAYQHGYPRLSRYTGMHAALVAGDLQRAAECGLDSVWARKHPKRAQELMALLAS